MYIPASFVAPTKIVYPLRATIRQLLFVHRSSNYAVVQFCLLHCEPGFMFSQQHRVDIYQYLAHACTSMSKSSTGKKIIIDKTLAIIVWL